MDEFRYYMVRISRPPAETQLELPLTGIVERLGFGEKQSFADGAELLRLLNGWLDRPGNMRPETTGGKA
jgi:hypothetical protein